ncbi:MAG TPA: hypothetical protein VGR35_04700 [Tepidisphaeraceae bacterium]|nr:hypothetical protein [Tepidisphaeraceae bacterium]
MFRLIKLAMYALFGYVLYELYLGMTQQQGGQSFGGGSHGRGGSFGGQRGNVGTLTGAGEGMTDMAADTGGGAMRHTVGRGVVSGNTTL